MNSEHPVVSRGRLTLYYLWQSEAERESGALIASRERWRAQLAEYDAGPEAWMREYFRKMVTNHARWRGVDAARSFGNKLVRQGHLDVSHLARALGC